MSDATSQTIGTIAGDIAATCDAMELESVIRQLEIVLKFARARSVMGQKLDLRLREAAMDPDYYAKRDEETT